MAESEEELKILSLSLSLFFFLFLQNFLMNVKEESEKSGLKLNIQETNVLVSRPTSLWQIQGKKKWKQWQNLFSWTPKSLQMMTIAMKLKGAS